MKGNKNQMARLSDSEKQQIVVDAIQGAGGEVPHNQLVDTLESSGNAGLAGELLIMAQRGFITPRVVANPDGAPVLLYVLPE